MPGLTNAESQATLDARFPTSGATDHVMFSANGTSETASLGRVAIGATGWAAATNADPSVKANANVLTTPAATGAVTVTHAAIITAASGGTQRTEWQALAQSKTLAIGDFGQFAVGAIAVTLT